MSHLKPQSPDIAGIDQKLPVFERRCDESEEIVPLFLCKRSEMVLHLRLSSCIVVVNCFCGKRALLEGIAIQFF